MYLPSAAKHASPGPEDLCAAVFDRGILVVSGPDGWRLPTVAELGPDGELVHVGSVDGRRTWAVAAGGVADGLVHLDWAGCTQTGGLTRLAARAIEVVGFRTSHRYCGACRSEQVDIDGHVGRRCPTCARVEFASAQPVALVAVWRIGPAGRPEVLLAKHTYGASHLWALVGGFVDPAESLEQAAHREVLEEVGLAVGDLTYLGSEAWGMSGPNVLLAAYSAQATDPTTEPVVDGHELAEARFFPFDALPDAIPPAYLIAGRVLRELTGAAGTGGGAATGNRG
jgi:NAD+ diphosphatase